jgi:hypothetical protein
MSSFKLIPWSGRTFISRPLTAGENQIPLEIAREFQSTCLGMSATEQHWNFKSLDARQMNATCHSGGKQIYAHIYTRDTWACRGHTASLYVFRGARLYFVLPEEVGALKLDRLWQSDDATQWIGK